MVNVIASASEAISSRAGRLGQPRVARYTLSLVLRAMSVPRAKVRQHDEAVQLDSSRCGDSGTDMDRDERGQGDQLPAPNGESVTIPPILLLAAICLRALRGPFLAWRELPAVTVAAAMRTSAVVNRGRNRSHTISPPHAPCSPQPAQSPGRRHCCRRRCALTAPFHPSPEPVGHRRVYSLLPSCVAPASPPARPRFLFRGAAFRLAAGGESGSSSGGSLQRRRITDHPG